MSFGSWFSKHDYCHVQFSMENSGILFNRKGLYFLFLSFFILKIGIRKFKWKNKLEITGGEKKSPFFFFCNTAITRRKKYISPLQYRDEILLDFKFPQLAFVFYFCKYEVDFMVDSDLVLFVSFSLCVYTLIFLMIEISEYYTIFCWYFMEHWYLCFFFNKSVVCTYYYINFY